MHKCATRAVRGAGRGSGYFRRRALASTWNFAMDKSAVAASNVSLAKATASIEAMRNAKTFQEFEAAWSDFLLAAGRVFSKLEQGAKVSGPSKDWFGRRKHTRRTDPLLSYIHHARNADEHGIERITELRPGSVAIGSTGATSIKTLTIETNKEGTTKIEGETSGDPLRITVTPSAARLTTVFDRGDKYEPPTEHLGAPISDPSPLVVAELALAYLRGLTDEASKLP
jgi:hypothetical protein